MTAKHLLIGLGGLDADLILRAAPDVAVRNIRGRRTAALAALCAALVIALLVSPVAHALFPNVFPNLPGGEYHPPFQAEFPLENLSASEVGEAFNMKYESVGTNSYARVIVPDITSLSLHDIPDTDTVVLYRFQDPGLPIGTPEFIEQAQQYDYALRQEFEISEPGGEYRSRDTDRGQTYRLYTSDGNTKEVIIDAEQSSQWERFSFSWRNSGKEELLDLQPSDEALFAALEPIREKVFRIFGVDFPDYRIRRMDHEVTISYYRKDENPLGKYLETAAVNYVNIAFFGTDGTEMGVFYRRYRVPTQDCFVPESQDRLISLEEAENLLRKGYVFGGHSCPICMANQEAVHFDTYDAVDFTYLSESGSVQGLYIPFYEFYKKIDTFQNGNTVYAKTYVCAIPLSGYDEYFQNQTKQHTS